MEVRVSLLDRVISGSTSKSSMENLNSLSLLVTLMSLWVLMPPAVSDPRCSKIVLHAWCSAETTHRVIHTLSSCDRDHVVGMLERRCRLNEQGHYCGSFADHIADIQEANTECLGSQVAGNCSTSCQEKLELLRNELGCCINEMLNTTRAWLYKRLFNYTLWEDCKVDTARESCGPSLLMKAISMEKANCSLDEVFSQVNLVSCNRTMLHPLLEMYESHGCSAIGEDQLNTCGVDEHRQWCLKRLVSKFRTIGILTRSAAIHCHRTDKCSRECKGKLQALREIMGCCLTNSLNNTFVELIYAETYNYFQNYTSYALWKTCGVPHPGYCDVVLHAAATAVTMVTCTSLLYALLALAASVLNTQQYPYWNV